MPLECVVTLFGEDVGHEEFVRAIAFRLGKEEGMSVDVHAVTSRGGHGRALSEFEVFQRALEKSGETRDVLVVAIDANCEGWNTVRNRILRAVRPNLFRDVAIACPDPHVERWYLSDPISLKDRFDVTVKLPRGKCDRGQYKRVLTTAFEKAGYVLSLGGAELARDIVEYMDLYRATRADASLRAFVRDLRGAYRRQA